MHKTFLYHNYVLDKIIVYNIGVNIPDKQLASQLPSIYFR